MVTVKSIDIGRDRTGEYDAGFHREATDRGKARRLPRDRRPGDQVHRSEIAARFVAYAGERSTDICSCPIEHEICDLSTIGKEPTLNARIPCGGSTGHRVHRRETGAV